MLKNLQSFHILSVDLEILDFKEAFKFMQYDVYFSWDLHLWN